MKASLFTTPTKAIGKASYVWVSKDGTETNVDHLDCDHMRNIIKMLMRNTFGQKIRRKDNTFVLSGDMANLFNEDQVDFESDEFDPGEFMPPMGL